MAAARNVSAAHSSTERCSSWKRVASLPMVVVLPEPFTPTTSTTAGGSRHARRSPFAGRQDFEQMLANQPFQLGGVVQLMPRHALADAVQNLLGGAHADVGGDQRELQFVEQVGVDFASCPGARLRARKPARRASSARRF